VVIVLMGAAGAGKTTVGRTLAGELGWRFVEGDDLHPPEHIDRMRRGEPLTDRDRAQWLAALHVTMARAVDRREPLVVACSALKAHYREALGAGLRRIRFVYLQADRALLQRRLEQRTGHFAGPALLASQLAGLEEPGDPRAITVPAAGDPEAIVHAIRRELGV
jgi:gluconokinase